MRRTGLFALVLIGLAFPAGLGLAVYAASGHSIAPPAATARVPTGTIARPSTPLPITDATTTTDEETTTDVTTTDADEDSGKGRGRGRGRSGSSNSGHGGSGSGKDD